MSSLENVVVLGARRAYEFRPDDLRLTALSTRPVQDLIGDAFQFESGGVDRPPPTFGAEPKTTPPGLVFNLGTWVVDEVVTPIRYLYVERSRIVIGVAAPSAAIDPIFEHLREIVGDIELVGGVPVLGPVQRVRDHSEVSARFSFSFDDLIAPAARHPINRAMLGDEPSSSLVVMPVTLRFQVQDPSREYRGAAGYRAGALDLSPRAGSPPDDHDYFSSAFLDSDSHVGYLEELNRSLSES